MVKPPACDGVPAVLVKPQDFLQCPLLLLGWQVGHVNVIGGSMKGMRLIKDVLCTPRQFHIGRGDGFFIRGKDRARGDEPECLLPGLVLDRGHVHSMRQQEVLIEIGMPEVDAIEVNIKLLQILTQSKVPEGAIVEPLVPLFKMCARREQACEEEQSQ
jgi:hypothetical protein